ncbi:hypothetical protein [Mangrovibacterium diazotrophicum]|uniref:Uncharacterized protein n=1 Tax=Mangrovibacterium diazotrophicum TaxID=1261403 RepID=A0A419W4J3_9BACT|nr:hypothetical protein [Mangrovibacterium diazotrophicum]RKD90356.1 hypothetical protein BC643_0693 [Mangrovibacterium diazotrophicum]
MIQITQKLMNTTDILPCRGAVFAADTYQFTAKHLGRVSSDVTVDYPKEIVDAAYGGNTSSLETFKRQILNCFRFVETSGIVGKSERNETAALRAAEKSLQDPPSK